MQRRSPTKCDASASSAVTATGVSLSSLPTTMDCSCDTSRTVATGNGGGVVEGKQGHNNIVSLSSSTVEHLGEKNSAVANNNKPYEKGTATRTPLFYTSIIALACIVYASTVLGWMLHGVFDQFQISIFQQHQDDVSVSAKSSTLSVSSWSNPLSSEMKDGCWQWEDPLISDNSQATKRKNNNNHVPLSQQQLQLQQPPRGLVVSLLLGRTVTDTICDFFPSQVKQFYLQQRGIDVLFLLPSSDSDHLSTSQPTMDRVLECLHLQGQQPVAIKTWNNLDGTKITTYEYTYDFMVQQQQQQQATTTTTTTKTNTTNNSNRTSSFRNNNQNQQQQPSQTETQQQNKEKKTFSVFLAYTTIRLPRYVKERLDLDRMTMNDGTSRLQMKNDCHASADYIQGTRWYVNEVLHLGILKEGNYEYFLKVDTDIAFRKPFPIHLLHDMKVRGAVFAHTARYFTNSRAVCGERSTDMLQEFRQHFIRHKYFGKQFDRNAAAAAAAAVDTEDDAKNNNNTNTFFWRKKLVMDSFDEMDVKKDHLTIDWISPSSWNGEICSANHKRMYMPHDLYYTNFIIGRTDYFQSPEVRALGQYMSEWPRGFFEYRWTDQIFYHFALGYFIGPDYEQPGGVTGGAVADYSEFRCTPLRNCWQSFFDTANFPNATMRCDNEGVFRHGKYHEFKTDWSIIDNWNVDQNNNNDQSFQWMLQSFPYKTTYVEQCPDHYHPSGEPRQR